MDASSTTISQPARPKKRTGTSKYDFIKVKVWLGEDLDHYYILSRFLICRMLTVTRIPYIKAVKIALETKKHLVDNNLHDVTQAQLEDVLFSIVRAKGFDEAHIDCYRMVTQFYQSRQPLCIIICGAAWTGKSTLAQQLASRINIPNVMQTDVIYELLRSGPDSPLHPAPLWARPGLAGGRCCDAALVREFRREARVVRGGMEGDLIKTLSDGKPIIIEGLHLDPGLYIPDFGSRGLIMLPARPSAALAAAAVAAAAGGPLQAAAAAGRSPGSSPLAGRGRYGRSQTLPAGAAAAAASAAAASSAAGQAAADQQQEDHQTQQQQLQQQRPQPVVVLRERSASASAEVSISAAGPLSPGSLVPSGTSVSAEAALELLRQSSAAGSAQQQQQGAAQCQQDLHSQQPQRLLHVSEEPRPAEQQFPSLPPLPPLRLRRQRPPQDVLSAEINGHTQGFSSSSTVQQCSLPAGACRGVGLSVQQSLLLGTPFADVAAAGAAAAAAAASASSPAAAAIAAATDVRPMDRLFSGPDELPVAMTGEQVQVCAAAAEAAALQQHRQEQQGHQQLQQQLQQQQVRPLPGSPFSSASDVSSLGLGGGSPPCISQEHSTTEVVSRVCSCASLGSPLVTLSQETSAADVASPPPPSAAAATAAAAAAAAGDGIGFGAILCKQFSGGGGGRSGYRVHGSAGVGNRYLEHLPEEQVEAQQQQQQQQQQQPAEQQPQQQLQPNGVPSYTAQQAGQLRPAAVSAPAALGASRHETSLGAAAYAAQPDPVALAPSGAAAAGDPDAAARQQGSAAADTQGLLAQPKTSAEASGIDVASAQVAEQPLLQRQQLQKQQVRQQGPPAVGLAGSPTAAQKSTAAESEPVGKPLFVPILVYMDEADHALMADEALAHVGLPSGSDTAAAGAGDRLSDSLMANGTGSSGGSSSCMHTAPQGAGARVGEGGAQAADGMLQQQGDVTVSEALRRVRLLQEYLCAYEAQGLPVVKVSYGAFGEALDKLHEYVLQCIKVAMQSRQSV